MGVGLDPSSELRVKKNRKETTIIEVNTIYSPALLNGWGLHMARPSPKEQIKEKEKKEEKSIREETSTVRQIQVHARHSREGSQVIMALEDPVSWLYSSTTLSALALSPGKLGALSSQEPLALARHIGRCQHTYGITCWCPQLLPALLCKVPTQYLSSSPHWRVWRKPDHGPFPPKPLAIFLSSSKNEVRGRRTILFLACWTEKN